MKEVVIIGGGLSGLSAARAVKENATANGLTIKVTLLEKEPYLGGKILSKKMDCFTCEAGPNGFLDNKPATMALVNRMGMEDRLLKSNDDARKRFIFTGGKLQQLPEDPMSFIMSEVLSIRGKARLAADFLLPQGEPGKDETVSEFVRRRLGEEALDKLIDPMSAGIYAGDPSVMSIISCFPKVKMIEDQFGGLLRGMLAMQQMAKAQGKKGPEGAGPGGVLWSFIDGASELPLALAKELGDDVRAGVTATSLERVGKGWVVKTSDGATLKADEVILASPAYNTGDLIASFAPESSAIMMNIPYVPMAVVCVGYEKDRIPMSMDGFGFLIPKKEGRKILGSLWSSSIFTHRAPDGSALITLMTGGARSPELTTLNDEELLKVCAAEVEFTMGIKEPPSFVNISRWKRAIPQYVVGHNKRVEKIEAELAEVGNIHLGGNAYYGIGINDCTARADILGEKVVSSLIATGEVNKDA